LNILAFCCDKTLISPCSPRFGREELRSVDVDNVEADAGEELAHEVEEVRQPSGVSQESAGQAT